MAATRTPLVYHQMLLLPADPPKRIRLDTAAWQHWLATADAFRYLAPHSVYPLTVRKEKRRHGWYWYAYLKSDAKLHNAYVGRSEAVTTTRLDQVLQTLLAKLRRHSQPRT
jgi:LuxR family maltose regulon positive regulatory protein